MLIRAGTAVASVAAQRPPAATTLTRTTVTDCRPVNTLPVTRRGTTDDNEPTKTRRGLDGHLRR